MHPESSNYSAFSTTNILNYTMSPYAPTSIPQANRIYVNKNFVPPAIKKNIVHLNPNFTRQVHVNPNFAKTNKVFVNPNVFNKIGPRPDKLPVSQLKPKQLQPPIIPLKAEQIRKPSTQPIVSKYSKINNINVATTRILTSFTNESRLFTASCNKSQYSINNLAKPVNKINATDAIVNTKTKLILVQSNTKPMSAGIVKPKTIITRHKLIRNETGVKGVIKSKYKLVRRSPDVLRTPMRMKQTLSRLSNALLNSPNRFKLDNRTRRQSCTIIKSRYKLTKKAYMMRLNPQNCIIKNTKFKLIRSVKLRKGDAERKSTYVKNNMPSIKPRRKLVKKKFVKQNLVKINKKKLQKNNIPCESYNRRGVCKGLASGKCTKKHNPNQIQICIWFLQGICRDDKCTLSHKASPEKMPTCKFFLEGICHKDNCPYLHVKLSKDAPVCRDFLNGYCAKANECDKRHQFLCPDFERDGKCARKLCRYPHGKAVRQYKDTLLNVIARNRKSKPRKGSVAGQGGKGPKRTPSAEMHAVCTDAVMAEADNKRYYECDANAAHENAASEVVEDAVSVFDRPKLGSLPSFISL